MLWIRLDGQGALHRQLYRALRAAILDGRLEPGAKLPATRAFAGELGLSRNTVLQAVDQLVAEGYVEGRTGSGTYVTRLAVPASLRDARPSAFAPPVGDPVPRRPPRLSAAGKRFGEIVAPGLVSWGRRHDRLDHDFRYGEPSWSDLPMETWTRLLARRARRLSSRRLSYQTPGGAPELRDTLAGYLARARGVVCSPERILITHGSQQAVDLVARILVDPGSPVVVEDPCYTGFSLALKAAGALLHSVRVDDQGLVTDELEDAGEAVLACVTPSHQYPAGSVLSLPRRLALLEWASRRDAHVLEDDYDGEFRFDADPVQCLQALDRDERVLYAGTASKMLFPALRIGWLVAPDSLLPWLRNAQGIIDTGTATLEQLVLADFIAEGHLERHVRRARTRCAARRAALLEAVGEHLGDRVRVRGASAGLHVLVEVPELGNGDVARLRRACRELGVGVYPAAPYYAAAPARAELLLGYSALAEDSIREGIRRLRLALDSLDARPGQAAVASTLPRAKQPHA